MLQRYLYNRRGAIVDSATGEVLYTSDSIETLSIAARNKLAELHSADPSLEWFSAEQALLDLGLISARPGLTKQEAVTQDAIEALQKRVDTQAKELAAMQQMIETLSARINDVQTQAIYGYGPSGPRRQS